MGVGFEKGLIMRFWGITGLSQGGAQGTVNLLDVGVSV